MAPEKPPESLDKSSAIRKQNLMEKQNKSSSEKNAIVPKSSYVKHGIDLQLQIRDGSQTSSSVESTERAQPPPKHKVERAKIRADRGRLMSPVISTSETSTSVSQLSISSSITKFRFDFDDMKCKMQIFGESLNLCKCIASDFKGKLTTMERRLQNLERRQRHRFIDLTRSESNYSAIIQKNKKLSNKTKKDVKKLQMCGTEEEMREVAARICRNYLHGAWKTVDSTELEFRRISGGLSNFLYYVALPEPAPLGGLRRNASPEEDGKQIDGSSSFGLDEPRKVLLRIYGQVHGERAMDAIVTESVIFTLLSERRLGPKLYGVFSGGRIEEFIAARPLLTKELSEPALSMKIAEKMAAIHSMNIPLSKEPNWIWKTMSKWLKTIRDEKLDNPSKAKNAVEESIIKRLASVDYEKEIEWLKKFLVAVESPVVFCHNDMQEGNILLIEDDLQATEEYASTFAQTYDDEQLYNPDLNPNDDMDPTERVSNNAVDSIIKPRHSPFKSRMSLVDPQAKARMSFMDRPSLSLIDTHSRDKMSFMDRPDDDRTSDSVHSHLSDSGEPKLVFIDFEYCAYNHRGFDIANHFQEWVLDYTNPEPPFYHERQEDAPTLEQKEIFIKQYLKHYQANQADDNQGGHVSIESINKLLAEVDAFALASHLFWTLWSIVNAAKSQIPFGYWEYGLTRLDTYLRLKQEAIKKDKFGLPQKRKICEVDI